MKKLNNVRKRLYDPAPDQKMGIKGLQRNKIITINHARELIFNKKFKLTVFFSFVQSIF